MSSPGEILEAMRYESGKLLPAKVGVATEYALTILLNGRELVTLLCSPAHLDELTIGYLHSEGLIGKADDVMGLSLNEQKGIARVWIRDKGGLAELPFRRIITPGCGRGATLRTPLDIGLDPVRSQLEVHCEGLLDLVRDFQRRSETWKMTHGVHAAALCVLGEVLLFREDIGRHNALDKVFGRCLIRGIDTRDTIVISSGRISSEMLLKVARNGVPVAVSLSSATDQAVELAKRLGITLVGLARGRKLTIYSVPERISL